jgi:endonuclease/exonuclease/phosphatase family metal-dependent hydrolase
MSHEYLIYLEQFLKVTSRKSKSIVLVGDLNQDLLSENGTNLKTLMASQNAIGKSNTSFQNLPTHIMKKSKTCIDVVFCNNHELISSTEVSSSPFSDHEFVSISLNLTPIKNGPITNRRRNSVFKPSQARFN